MKMHETTAKIVGSTTTYCGYKVRIVAVIKNALRIEERGYLTDDDEIARAGGVTVHDRIEVAPWIEKEGCFSFVTIDPKAMDLACFADTNSDAA